MGIGGAGGNQVIKTVFTYLDRPDPIQQAMVELWRRSWDVRGWSPVVLDLQAAQRHPAFDRFDRQVRSYPTVNPENYEAACFERWLALEVVGGGLMTDYDVLNARLTYPATLPAAPIVALDVQRIPCAVYTTQGGAAEMVRWFSNRRRVLKAVVSERGQPHTSDMHVFQSCFHGPVVPLCGVYGGPENTPTPLWHVSSSAANCTGRDKLIFLEHVFRWIV